MLRRRINARAIIAAAEEDGGTAAVDEMAVSLRDFRDAYRGSDVLRDVILNPAMSEEREAVLEALFPKLDTSKHTSQLIRMLADRGTMAILLCEQYYDFAAELADQYLVMERGEVVQRGHGKDMAAEGARERMSI